MCVRVLVWKSTVQALPTLFLVCVCFSLSLSCISLCGIPLTSSQVHLQELATVAVLINLRNVQCSVTILNYEYQTFLFIIFQYVCRYLLTCQREKKVVVHPPTLYDKGNTYKRANTREREEEEDIYFLVFIIIVTPGVIIYIVSD
jgi:hypothetical protein